MSAPAKSFQELINGPTPVLVDFYATWCGPCKMMQPVLEETAKQVGSKVKILKVDVDKNPLAASSFQVRGVPTLILFKRGKILWRESGVVPAHQLVKILESNLAEKA
ncbi:thioredoxin [Algoriphagus vanfongensis]|uniref:thioredoxin n=1 Tax=Algoriphagus vanfongensis TaxID=426371 RepID=UPI0004233836|nr:thioredoxin [Algoriphagus vanfongensis]